MRASPDAGCLARPVLRVDAVNVIERATTLLDALLPVDELSDLPPRQIAAASRAAVLEVVEAWPIEVRALWTVVVLLTWFVAPALLLGRPRPFGALPGAERAALLARLGRSRVYLARASFTLLKVAAGLRLGALALAEPEPLTLPSTVIAIERGRRRLPVVVAVAGLEVRHA